MIDVPQSEDEALARLIDEAEARIEDWMRRDRERETEAREWAPLTQTKAQMETAMPLYRGAGPERKGRGA